MTNYFNTEAYYGELYLRHLHEHGYPENYNRKKFNRKFYDDNNLVDRFRCALAVSSIHSSLKGRRMPAWVKRNSALHSLYADVLADYKKKYQEDRPFDESILALISELNKTQNEITNLQNDPPTLDNQAEQADEGNNETMPSLTPEAVEQIDADNNEMVPSENTVAVKIANMKEEVPESKDASLYVVRSIPTTPVEHTVSAPIQHLENKYHETIPFNKATAKRIAQMEKKMSPVSYEKAVMARSLQIKGNKTPVTPVQNAVGQTFCRQIPVVKMEISDGQPMDQCSEKEQQLMKEMEQLKRRFERSGAMMADWKKRHDEEKAKYELMIAQLEYELKRARFQMNTLAEKIRIKDMLLRDKERTIRILSYQSQETSS